MRLSSERTGEPWRDKTWESDKQIWILGKLPDCTLERRLEVDMGLEAGDDKHSMPLPFLIPGPELL